MTRATFFKGGPCRFGTGCDQNDSTGTPTVGAGRGRGEGMSLSRNRGPGRTATSRPTTTAPGRSVLAEREAYRHDQKEERQYAKHFKPPITLAENRPASEEAGRTPPTIDPQKGRLFLQFGLPSIQAQFARKNARRQHLVAPGRSDLSFFRGHAPRARDHDVGWSFFHISISCVITW